MEESLVFILMQELFENDLYDIDYLACKYTMNDSQIELLNNIYNELYGDEEDE
jgi:hypothetical protein